MNKLLLLQQQIKAIKKDSENPFYHSAYFDINSLIAELKPLLNDLALIVLQPLGNINGRVTIKTLVIDAEDGKTIIESETLVPDLSDPQKLGAAITYCRRYALQSLFLLEAADDDGNTASGVSNNERNIQKTFNEPVYTPEPKRSVNPGYTPIPKVEGGVCPSCGVGKMIKSPKSGNIFCSEKCWLINK